MRSGGWCLDLLRDEQYFRRVVELVPRLPMFLDKPLAGNLEDGQRIIVVPRKKIIDNLMMRVLISGIHCILADA